ncbi:hypothetical protein CFELI_10520 [Corynebacterium felinum]|nr:hypothetical protein CFELI_10520 [Corynebacterium felinum]
MNEHCHEHPVPPKYSTPKDTPIPFQRITLEDTPFRHAHCATIPYFLNQPAAILPRIGKTQTATLLEIPQSDTMRREFKGSTFENVSRWRALFFTFFIYVFNRKACDFS